MEVPILYTKNVCRDYRSGHETVHALSNVSVEIPKGKLTILRGRSGSGKTTLLNSLGALDFPTSGEIWFEGTDITKLSETERDEFRRLNTGFVFQSVALMANMSAYENVEFGMRIAGTPAAERQQRAMESLDLVGLSKRASHRPQEMSGGEQQRVAIARAISHRPKLIFADEPTAELDTAMGLYVMKTFKDLIEKEGVTIVMTTHDPNMMEIADVVYSLQDGVIVDG
ncbi:MAG: macrolide ABC transporter ATP-binding protein [Clostridiales bacterium]|nr:MAG: macrolide ABC transporter ATP-binding protein [Clostridiales bacterium]